MKKIIAIFSKFRHRKTLPKWMPSCKFTCLWEMCVYVWGFFFILFCKFLCFLLHLYSKQGVCHSVALPFTLKSILRQQKSYGYSNFSPCKNIIFQKSSKRIQNPSSYYITLQLISSFSTIQNITFQKSSYKRRPIT